MIATKLSLADYLSLESGPENRCEFVDGEILEMPPESSLNTVIAVFLMAQFLKVFPFTYLRHKDTEVVVAGRVRLPDLLVLGANLAQTLAGSRRSTITEAMPAPLVVVEVVSPGKTNADRDYRYKRSEYAARGIAEYWIVDPTAEKVTILTLVDGLYEVEEFRGDEQLRSHQVPALTLTAAQLLNPESTLTNQSAQM